MSCCFNEISSAGHASLIVLLSAAILCGAYFLLSDDSDDSASDAWEWNSSGQDYELEFSVSDDELSTVSSLTSDRIPLGTYDEKLEMFREAAILDETQDGTDCVSRLSEELTAEYGSEVSGSSDFLNYLLEFIRQNISYSEDIDLYGIPDWIAYPEETLNNRAGDCEDMAILFVFIAHMIGYDCGLALFDGHVIAMVALESYTLPEGWAVESYYVYNHSREADEVYAIITGVIMEFKMYIDSKETEDARSGPIDDS